MAKSLSDFINELPKSEQVAIEDAYLEQRQILMTLQELRKARKLTQERMAEMLHIQQYSVSKMENRADLLLSTLRSYIEAMGGDLKLIVEFPDRETVVLKGFSDLNDSEDLESSHLIRAL